MADRRYTTEQFAQVIRSLYPTLNSATDDDRKLTHAVLTSHPEFKDHIIDPLEGVELLAPLPTRGAPPPSQQSQAPYAGPGRARPVTGRPRRTADIQLPNESGRRDPDLSAGPPSPISPEHFERQDDRYFYEEPAPGEPPEGLLAKAGATPFRGARRVAGGLKAIGSMASGGAFGTPPPAPLTSPEGLESPEPTAGAYATQPIRDILGGALEAGTPLLIPAVISNPLGTAAALGAGAAAGTAAEKTAEVAGAPPWAQEMSGQLAGLIGGVIGEGYVGGRQAKALAAKNAAEIYRQDVMPAEHAALQGDLAREQRLGASQQAWDYYQEQLRRQKTEDSVDQFMLGLAENYRLDQIRKAHKAGQIASGSPFDYLTEAGRESTNPRALPPGPPDRLALGPGSPATFLAGPSDQVFPGPSPADPNLIDVTDPSTARPTATSEGPPPPLIQTLGEQLASTLEQQPQPHFTQPPGPPPRGFGEIEPVRPTAGGPPPRLSRRTLDRIRTEQEYARQHQLAQEYLDEMDQLQHQHGGQGLLEAIAKNGGIGEDKGFPGEVADLWHNSTGYVVHRGTTKMGVGKKGYRLKAGGINGVRGVVSREGLSLDAMVERLRQDPNFGDTITTPRELLDAIHEARKNRLPRRPEEIENVILQLFGERRVPEDVISESPTANDTSSILGTGEEGKASEAGTPPPPGFAAAGEEDIPDFLRDLQPEDVPGGYEPEEIAARGLGQETPPPGPIEATSPAEELPEEPPSLSDRIRQAFSDITGGNWNQRVRLKDIRDKLPDVDRDTLDKGLRQLEAEDPGAGLLRLDNNKEITPEDTAAELRVGTESRHLLWLTRDRPGRQATRLPGMESDDVRPLPAVAEAPPPGFELTPPPAPITEPVQQELPTAEFIGYGGDPANPEPMYNISGGARDRSTVSAETLAAEGIEVPDTPPYAPEHRLTQEKLRQRMLDNQQAQRRAREAKAGGDRARQMAETEAKLDDEAKWQQLMKAKLGDVLYHVERLPKDQAQRFIERFEASPGGGQGRIYDALVQHVDRGGIEPSLFERLTGEAGHMVLNVSPTNRRGMGEWLQRHAEEHGDEPWHEQALAAFKKGDTQTAWRISAMAVGKSIAAEAGGAAADQRQRDVQVSGGVPDVRGPARPGGAGSVPGEAGRKQPDLRIKKAREAAEQQIGHPLPPGIDINAEGIMTFGKPEHALRASATDLLLGKHLAEDVIQAADPTKIIRVEGNQDPELRINRQIADQLVRSMPDEIVQPLLELTKVESREEFAKHFARTVSSWGRGLRMLKDWQDDHWAEIVHLAKVQEGSGEDFDVVGLSNTRTPNGFVKWLHTDATAEDLDLLGFKVPQNIKKGTAEYDSFAKKWFRAQKTREARAAELAKSIEDLAKGHSAADRAMMAGALEPPGTKSRGTLDAVENTSRAFLISKPVTMIRNTWSQAGRYTTGILEDVFAAAYSGMTLNPKEAARYMNRATELAKAPFRKGGASARSMVEKPWDDSFETVYNFIGDNIAKLPAEDQRKTLAIMHEFPGRAATFTGALGLESMGAGEAAPKSKIPLLNKLIDPKVRNVATVLNRMQEFAFRGSVFDATMRAQLADRGLDPSVELAGDPTALIAKLGEREVDQMVGASVAASLDYTFAAKPYPGSIPGMILQTFSNIPVFSAALRMGFPFPRFNWVSAPRWLYDHGPAALLDIPLGLMAPFTSEGAPLKGRLYRGLEGQQIETTMLPGLAAKIGKAEYDQAGALQEFVSAKVDAQAAAKQFKAIEARAAKSGMLPELHTELVEVGRQLQEKIATAESAKAQHAEATTSIKEMKRQQKTLEEKLLKIKEIGAPTLPEYFARQTVGMLMLAAAYHMRSQEGAKDTKWYEYNLNIPGSGRHTVDLRSVAPFVQYLLPADVIHSIVNDTDWDGVRQYFKDSDSTKANPFQWEQAMHQHYHGKYTEGSAAKEAAAAFLTISPAAGTTASLADFALGRTGTPKEGAAQMATSALLSTVGQFVGRFTVPLQTISDITGQFHHPAAIARIPEEPSAEHMNVGSQLLGPTIANIPELRESIPPKVNPLTGQPIQTVNPLARALGGLTERDKSRFENEIANTGVDYSKMVPRQVGDREFDNAVAVAYAAALQKYGTRLLDNKRYQSMTPELKRDLLGSSFGGLKAYAYYQAGKELGLSGRQTHTKTEAKGVKDKRSRWEGYMKDLHQELLADHPELAKEDDEPAGGSQSGPPAGFTIPTPGGLGGPPSPF